MCVLGKRLVKDITIDQCYKNGTGALHDMFCNATTGICDEYYKGKWKIFFFVNEQISMENSLLLQKTM